MTDSEQPEPPIISFHPARIVELSAEIMSLSFLDYTALMGRLAALQNYSESRLLPIITSPVDSEHDEVPE